jgi:uncharacterized membrane protein YgcG
LGWRGKSARRPRSAGAKIATGLALIGATAALASCGSDESARQDADEPAGEFPVNVDEAKFPNRQRLAEQSDLVLAVENIGDEQLPELAVTIEVDDGSDGSFSTDIDQENVAAKARPVWILEENYPKIVEPGVQPTELDAEPSAGAEAAQTNTFAFGPLAPGDNLTMDWRVTPVKAGTYTVNYEVAAGLTGKAKAVTADGSPAEGSFVVTITDKPPAACVDQKGQVVTGGDCGPAAAAAGEAGSGGESRDTGRGAGSGGSGSSGSSSSSGGGSGSGGSGGQ